MQGLIASLVVLAITGLGTLLFKVHPAYGRKLALYVILAIVVTMFLIVAYSLGELKIANGQFDRVTDINKHFVTNDMGSEKSAFRKRQIEKEVLDSVKTIFSVSIIQKDIIGYGKYYLFVCFASICILAGLIGVSVKLEQLTNNDNNKIS